MSVETRASSLYLRIPSSGPASARSWNAALISSALVGRSTEHTRSTTGAARATSLVLEAMKGKLDGTSLRVPIPDGSITDFTAILRKEASVEEINAAFKTASETGPMADVLVYSEAPIVSSDIVGSPASCTFDAPLTMVMGDLVKVFGWYDNEWGYSNRVVDLILRTAGK